MLERINNDNTEASTGKTLDGTERHKTIDKKYAHIPRTLLACLLLGSRERFFRLTILFMHPLISLGTIRMLASVIAVKPAFYVEKLNANKFCQLGIILYRLNMHVNSWQIEMSKKFLLTKK